MTRYIPETCSTSKTYKTEEKAVKRAEELLFKLNGFNEARSQKYIIMIADNGRYVPVFIGERAIQMGLHHHAHVLG